MFVCHRKVQHHEKMLAVVLHLGQLPPGGAVFKVDRMKLVVEPKLCGV